MKFNLLRFNTEIGRSKPETLFHESNKCPFCDVEHLENVIDVDEDVIFLKNKYNVVEGADQFVLIESSKCNSDMPEYTLEQMQRVMKMGIKHWKELLMSGKYEEVLYFKNYGVLSGGTIRHPHMQLVGIPKLDSELLFEEEELQGIEIKTINGIEMNVSDRPRIGFGEINIIVKEELEIETVSKFIQSGVDYIKKRFSKNKSSYNIFFYHRGGKIYIKIIPRFATSPYFVGYNIRFRPNNVERIAEEIREEYFD